MPVGRIDVHAHLLPGVDDGCRTVEESIDCAQQMVAAGYTHLFCTPHIWDNLDNDPTTVYRRVADLQRELDSANVGLKLLPGGEMHITPDFCETFTDRAATYNGGGKFGLFDFWTHKLPDYLSGCIDHLLNLGITPILAHPERIEAIQTNPAAIEPFLKRGLLIQCNLEPLGDDRLTLRRTLAERWLSEGKYFMLGSDLHRSDTLQDRLRGLERAIELVGEETVWQLTHTNPAKLI